MDLINPWIEEINKVYGYNKVMVNQKLYPAKLVNFKPEFAIFIKSSPSAKYRTGSIGLLDKLSTIAYLAGVLAAYENPANKN